MAQLKYVNGNVKWQIDSVVEFNASSQDVQRFIDALIKLHDFGNLQTYKVTKDESVYKMRIEPLDFGIDYQYTDSQWLEKFKPSDWINANVVGLIRPVTEAVLPILLQYQITKIDFDWA